MKRNTLNFLIDLISLLVMLGLILTGLLMRYVLPHGQGRGRSMTLWGLDRHDYGDIHFWLAAALISLILVHVWLHWGWCCTTLSKMLGGKAPGKTRQNIFGVIFLLILIVFVAGGPYLARTQVRTATYESRQSDPSFISGQMSLSEAARIGGMTAAELIRKLNLPADTDPHEQLGRLRRFYGFEMQKVRNIVEKD
ncbi:MAG: DUF4405 domain-containing protein [Sedimentisphaerales bacterium]|nr:DUF4405 domain-containing protein [Sedimentisphaerales bacterium]